MEQVNADVRADRCADPCPVHAPDFAPDVLKTGAVQHPSHADQRNKIGRNDKRPGSELAASLNVLEWWGLSAQHTHDSARRTIAPSSVLRTYIEPHRLFRLAHRAFRN